jgi:putative thioredoxin
MRVQSIPAVYAFRNGQPVDGFTGAVPESQLRAFVDKLLGDAQSPLDAVLEQAQQLADSGQADQARSLYEQIIGQDSENPKALAGLIRLIIEAGDIEEANVMIDALAPSLKSNTEIAGVISMLELAEQSNEAGDVQELREKLSTNEKDHQVRFDLAMALYSNGDNENAVEELLEILRRDQKWNEEAARIQLLKILEVLGFNHPISVTTRRKISAILFT